MVCRRSVAQVISFRGRSSNEIAMWVDVLHEQQRQLDQDLGRRGGGGRKKTNNTAAAGAKAAAAAAAAAVAAAAAAPSPAYAAAIIADPASAASASSAPLAPPSVRLGDTARNGNGNGGGGGGAVAAGGGIVFEQGDGHGGDGLTIRPVGRPYTSVVVWLHGLGDTPYSWCVTHTHTCIT